MNNLLLIRHAETDMSGTFCGQSDPPVNTAGDRQIQQLIERLREEPIAAVFTSDLQRAWATARALADFFAVPCITRPSLQEIHFGDWEGLTWSDIEHRDSTYATRWINSFPKMSAPKGEPVENFEARVKAEIGYLLHHNPCGLSLSDNPTIAVVTHAGVMRAMLRGKVDESEAWSLTKHYCCTIRYSPATHSAQQEKG